ncbi:DUF1766-domain-containing protein [Westerdykella ornata]|uniref:DUF1766-domain-containing protein n=1 Tax=Westerdykella ornata TaxID=318751 RepID=A0A6A6JTP8_WESOR|nr:DUF1766-domain-containing protein [Westerdykella ornata]KAF2279942.1 DUF1766-domain-containing protein [Westerdykella ornata]
MARGKSTDKASTVATKSPSKEVVLKEPPSSHQYGRSNCSGKTSDSFARQERQSAERKDRAGSRAQTPTKPRGTRNSKKTSAQNPVHGTLSPVAVSPAESHTSYDSADSDGYPWSTPERSHGNSSWGGTASTPLTPPTTGRHAEEKTPIHLKSPLPRAKNLSRKQAGDARVPVSKEDSESGHEDEEFGKNPKPSRRLFQNIPGSKPTNENKDNGAGPEIKSDGLRESSLLGFIIPFDVHKRYSEARTTCVATTVKKPYKRCEKRRAPKEDVLQNAFLSLRNCFTYYQERRYDEFWNILENFVTTALCHSHRKTAMKERKMEAVEAYIKRLSNDKKHATLPDVTPCFTTSEFEAWIEAISDSIGADPETGATSTIKSNVNLKDADHKTTLSPTFDRPPPLRTDSYPLEIIGLWQPKKTIGMPVNEAIFEVIWRTWRPKKQENGFIYVLAHHSRPGYRKIGYSKDSGTRRGRWDADCDRHHAEVSLPENGYVLHAERVEKLIHAELKDVRVKVKCDRCNREHTEWFKVTEEHLRKVFEKWKEWIQQHPYTQGVGKIWMLKADMIAHLEKDCEPVKLEKSMERRLAMARTIKVEAST